MEKSESRKNAMEMKCKYVMSFLPKPYIKFLKKAHVRSLIIAFGYSGAIKLLLPFKLPLIDEDPKDQYGKEKQHLKYLAKVIEHLKILKQRVQSKKYMIALLSVNNPKIMIDSLIFQQTLIKMNHHFNNLFSRLSEKTALRNNMRKKGLSKLRNYQIHRGNFWQH